MRVADCAVVATAVLLAGLTMLPGVRAQSFASSGGAATVGGFASKLADYDASCRTSGSC